MDLPGPIAVHQIDINVEEESDKLIQQFLHQLPVMVPALRFLLAPGIRSKSWVTQWNGLHMNTTMVASSKFMSIILPCLEGRTSQFTPKLTTLPVNQLLFYK